MSTVDTILPLVTEALGTDVTTKYTEAKKIRAISFARREAVSIFEPDEFMKDGTLTFTSKKATIPSDYYKWTKLFDSDNTIFRRVRINDFDDPVKNTWTIKDDSGTRKVFISEDSVTTATLRYVKEPTELTATTDELELPTFYDEGLAYLAAAKLLRDDRQFESGVERRNEGLRLIRNASANMQQEQEDQAFASVNSIYDDGIDLFSGSQELLTTLN